MTQFAREKRPFARLRWTAAAIALTAFGAVPVAAWAEDAPIPEVTITGSAIKGNPDAASANPITIISAAEIARTGATTVESILTKLPSIGSQGTTANLNNGGLGTSTADLRNLNTSRTLVLVDGKRFVSTDSEGTNVAVDLNSIPVDLIDHIEVLRDGASPIYGSDAIAGVVNIILKKNFSGLSTNGGVGISSRGDNTSYKIDATLGQSWDRGNVTLNLGYDNRDPIAQKDRQFSRNQFYPELGGPGGATLFSGTPPGLRAKSGVNKQFTSPTTTTPWTSDSFFDLSNEPYLTSGLERKSFNGSGHFNLTDDIIAVADFYYTNRNSRQQLNPEPLSNAISTTKYPGLFIPDTYIDPSDGLSHPNPYYVAANAALGGTLPAGGFNAATRRFEGGDRQYLQDVVTYRLHTGFEGVLLNKYNWETGYVYGKSDSTNRTFGEVNFAHLSQLTGQTPCSAADALVGCSLANFFGTNTLTPQNLAYLQFINTRTTQVAQDYWYAHLDGPIVDLPAGPLKFALGVEHRTESGFDHPDAIIVNGDGNSDAKDTTGQYTVTEGFAEFNVPLFKDLPFVKSLTADGAMRYSDYSNFGSAITWKAGLDYAIDDNFRIRAGNGIGFRAPQVKELYGGKFQNFPSTSDPCDTSAGSGGRSTPVIAANCDAALTALGINPATFVPASNQTATTNGGNPNLQPETSTNWSAGLVFTPTFVPNLQVTIDYYKVTVQNAIGIFGTSDIINNCYSSAGLSDPSCAAITRKGGVAAGNITNVNALFTNAGFVKTDGLDFDIDYNFDLAQVGLPDVGSISLKHQSELLMNFTDTLPNGTIEQLRGRFDELTVGTPNYADFKMSNDIVFSRDNWTVGGAVRYISGMHSKYVDQGSEVIGQPGASFGGIWYEDISGSYTWNNITFRAGIDNIADQQPPFVNDGSTNSLTSGGFDFIGRFYWVTTSVKF
jgi:iron complex outermembrane receptor protein